MTAYGGSINGMRRILLSLVIMLASLVGLAHPTSAFGPCPVAQIPMISTSGRSFVGQRSDGVIYTWGNSYAGTWWVHVEAASGKKIATVTVKYHKNRTVYAIPNKKMWEKQTLTLTYGRPTRVLVCLWP